MQECNELAMRFSEAGRKRAVTKDQTQDGRTKFRTLEFLK